MIAPTSGFPTRWLTPALVLALLVWGFPLAYAVGLSMTDAGPGVGGSFLGLQNYLRAFADPTFGRSLVVSAIFASGEVLLGVGLGFFLALGFYRGKRTRNWLQVALLLPWAVSEIAVALVWHSFLGEQTGLVNWFLGGLGLAPIAWKTSAVGAMTALWLASLWHGLAFSVLFQMAGLASLRTELLQAAELDGASRWRILRHIVLPHQRPTLVANALLVWMSGIIAFSLPFALTGGGPLGATELVSLYSYNVAFGGQYELGYAAALGMIVLALYAVFAFWYIRRRRAA
ncbi:MAG: sugar ABC transporter permease [Candidatus Lernaella stagnicola]|nr:sugar ABC transporter permease [Candidatus Lernaella stagnicola]